MQVTLKCGELFFQVEAQVENEYTVDHVQSKTPPDFAEYQKYLKQAVDEGLRFFKNSKEEDGMLDEKKLAEFNDDMTGLIRVGQMSEMVSNMQIDIRNISPNMKRMAQVEFDSIEKTLESAKTKILAELHTAKKKISKHLDNVDES